MEEEDSYGFEQTLVSNNVLSKVNLLTLGTTSKPERNTISWSKEFIQLTYAYYSILCVKIVYYYRFWAKENLHIEHPALKIYILPHS